MRVTLSTVLACSLTLSAQQLPDRAFRPAVENPAYAVGDGPTVCLDEGHANSVRASRTTFTPSTLSECRVLVIANAQPSADAWNTYPYPTPPAFSPDEIEATHRWVRGGGSLLLIADHMPLAGAAARLAASFGVTFTDGFALEGFGTEAERPAALAKPTIFRAADQTLRPHAIVRGRNPGESVAMNAPDAERNYQFVLNVMHGLLGRL